MMPSTGAIFCGRVADPTVNMQREDPLQQNFRSNVEVRSSPTSTQCAQFRRTGISTGLGNPILSEQGTVPFQGFPAGAEC